MFLAIGARFANVSSVYPLSLARNMLRLIADTIILCPSRDEIPASHKLRRSLAHGREQVDLWVEHVACRSSDEAELFVLKFGGAGSRAERASAHPLDFWSDIPAEVWGVNWPGFGASSGRASLAMFPAMGHAVCEELRRVAGGRPIVVTGNSLGTAIALHVVAAHGDVSGLILRNPPPLRQLIVSKHGWWNAWVGAWLISTQVPRELDSLVNARRSSLPAVFVTSGKDRVVPPQFQDTIFEAYAGPKRRIVLPDSDHADPPGEGDQAEYDQHLHWLRQHVFATAALAS